MLRMSVDTKLTPVQVIEKASQHFGAKGLAIDAEQSAAGSAVYTGAGGYVSVQATSVQGGPTEVILETREWDYDTRRFAEMIA